MLIFGICGALRCIELINLKVDHVEDKDDKYIVLVQDTKTYLDRSFVIGTLYYAIVKKYISLRPPDSFTDRFFIQYHDGRCSKQVMGKNKIGSMPSAIASLLELQNSSGYTGHSFRRTSATLLSNSGAGMPLIKQLGGWKSDSVAAGYIASSIKTENVIFEGITNKEKNESPTIAMPSTSRLNNNEILEVEKLGITYADFSDSDSLLDQQVEFTTARGKSVVPNISVPNCDIKRKFTDKPSIKLYFAPKKKLKPQEEDKRPLAAMDGIDNINKIPFVNSDIKKDSKTVLINCTVNGNVINNYYFYNSESKENINKE